jgi:hypothetical protein
MIAPGMGLPCAVRLYRSSFRMATPLAQAFYINQAGAIVFGMALTFVAR